MNRPILLIQTGGTIDKKYPQKANAYGFEIEEAAFHRILNKANVAFDFETITLCRKDSQEINLEDIERLINICSNTNHSKIIITHGTDTINLTAKYLTKIKDKAIILTGSYLPECVKNSDADFNLGVACGAICFIPNGIYVALKGVVQKIDS